MQDKQISNRNNRNNINKFNNKINNFKFNYYFCINMIYKCILLNKLYHI